MNAFSKQYRTFIKQAVKHNKPRHRVAHRCIARFLRIDEKCKQVVPYGHSTPSLKISCKSVQQFSRNLANKETNKERKIKIDRKQYPDPRCIVDGVIHWIGLRITLQIYGPTPVDVHVVAYRLVMIVVRYAQYTLPTPTRPNSRVE